MKRLLIGSTICQKPQILEAFLKALKSLDLTDIKTHYYFIDDNVERESVKLLHSFKEVEKEVVIITSNQKASFVCDEEGHQWTTKQREKVVCFKNSILSVARESAYDYLLLIDSDILMHPQTVKKLISDKKEIVATLVWTKWQKNSYALPQVWLKNNGSFYDYRINEMRCIEDIRESTHKFLEELNIPGVYSVGGLGACTLLSREALKQPIGFQPIYNTSFESEDSSFCVRAAALGIPLFVDTYYPAYHIYRPSDLEGVKAYEASNKERVAELEKMGIRNVLIKGLETLMTFTYDTPASEQFKSYFTEEEGENQWIQLKHRIASTKEVMLTSKAQVQSCQLTLDEEKNCTAKVGLQISGYMNEWAYSNIFECVCNLIKNENGDYVISHFSVNGLLEAPIPSFVRRVREKPKLTLSMCVRNEGSRYLGQMLSEIEPFIDQAVIIDDGSSDNTGQLCKEVLGAKLTLRRNSEPLGDNQATIRYQQWQETVRTDPDWILFLDADELLEKGGGEMLRGLMANRDIDTYCFRRYDFWNENGYYREDPQWCRHKTYRPFMTRFQPYYKYTFIDLPLNEQRMPLNVTSLPLAHTDIRIKHLGYAKRKDREVKYLRYMEQDKQQVYRDKRYYESLLEDEACLIKWEE